MKFLKMLIRRPEKSKNSINRGASSTTTNNMDLKEINSQIEKWVKESESRSVILIALQKNPESSNKNERNGVTCLQMVGKKANLVQSVAESLMQCQMPLREIVDEAIDIDINRQIDVKFHKMFRCLEKTVKEGGKE